MSTAVRVRTGGVADVESDRSNTNCEGRPLSQPVIGGGGGPLSPEMDGPRSSGGQQPFGILAPSISLTSPSSSSFFTFTFPPPSTFTMLRSIPRQLQRQPLRAITPSRVALRSFTCGYPRMSLPPVQPPVSTTLPSDAFQLLSTPEKAGSAEDALYEQQIRDVEAWWNSPRYEGIKRPYSAADVVSKRGSLQQTYPSSLMARKLFNLLNERAAAGEPVHTSKSDFARALDRTGLTLFNSGCH